MVIYLVMGWLILIAAKPLVAALDYEGIFWLVVGGVVYTFGVIFFILDTRLKHAHGIWHLFVVAGSICQYFSILFYVNR